MQRGRNLEKERLVNFIATIMEDSGFKIKKNYKISDQIIDIYGLLETSVGDVGVVVACKNYGICKKSYPCFKNYHIYYK